MKIVNSFFYILLLILPLPGFGKQFQEINPSSNVYLQVGDTLPNIYQSAVINFERPEVHLNDFRGRYLILDFWSVTCKGCISAMPEMARLQSKYKDQLQILMVTKDSEEKVAGLFRKVKKVANLGLPSIVSDTQLIDQFAFVGYPLHVWVDPNGVILYITDGINANSTIIERVLSGERPKLRTRFELPKVDFRALNVVNIEDSWGKGEFLSYGTGYIRGLKGESIRVLVDSISNEPVGLAASNIPLRKLITDVYMNYLGKAFIKFNNRVVVENDTSEFLTGPGKSDMEGYNRWNEKVRVCYKLKFPGLSKQGLYQMAVDDIAKFWGYRARIEWRKLNCLKLKRINLEARFYELDTTRQPFVGRGRKNSAQIILRNVQFNSFLGILSMKLGKLKTPFLDATGIDCTRKVSLDFNDGFEGVKGFNREFKKYGLFIEEEEDYIEVLIISKINGL